jgi:hypothetical protein
MRLKVSHFTSISGLRGFILSKKSKSLYPTIQYTVHDVRGSVNN